MTVKMVVVVEPRETEGEGVDKELFEMTLGVLFDDGVAALIF